jgi:hypothetical protein
MLDFPAKEKLDISYLEYQAFKTISFNKENSSYISSSVQKYSQEINLSVALFCHF